MYDAVVLATELYRSVPTVGKLAAWCVAGLVALRADASLVSREVSGAPAVTSAVSTARVDPDSAKLLEQLRKDAIAFLERSQKAWTESELRRHGSIPSVQYLTGVVARRFFNAHCHRDGSLTGDLGPSGARGIPPTFVPAANSTFSVCPDWQPPPSPQGLDETNRPDAALMMPWFAEIATARAELVKRLDDAAKLYPGDTWIVGQRVRFREDAGETELALRAARECRADRSFCRMLEGYALFANREVLAADSVFVRALAEMPVPARCEWGSIALLLPRAARDAYEKLSCAQRDSVDRAAWWLSDPMYSEPGNERRAEHFARVVRANLQFTLPRNERWDLRTQKGGDALRAMFIRYGWPTATYYGGLDIDRGHDLWLGADATPPYSVPEYSMGRLAVLPIWDAIREPFNVEDSDFTLVAPAGSDAMAWWPREHFLRSLGVIATFDRGQVAMFRRDSSIQFASVSRLQPASPSAHAVGVAPVSLVISRRPDAVRIVDSQRAKLGSRTVLRGPIPSGPAIVGVEAAAERGARNAVRSRYGIVAPPTLSEMRENELAISDPVLYDVSAYEASRDPIVDNIFDLMYADLSFSGLKKLGVFWESYGFAPGDSADVEVRMARVSSVGRMRRIGMAMRVAGNPNGTIAARWTEPQPGRSASSIQGVRPILARQVSLDIGNLAPGIYQVIVSMRRKGGVAQSAGRTFVVAR